MTTHPQLCFHREVHEEAVIYDQVSHQAWHGIEDENAAHLEAQADEAGVTSP